MRTEVEITAELAALRTEYHKQSQTAPSPALAQMAVKIRTTSKELSAVYSNGAKACPKCKGAPIGMLRSPASTAGDRPVFAIYEVGCLNCKPEIVQVDGEQRRKSYSAFGVTPADAVKNWNDGKFNIDKRLDGGPQATVGQV